MARTPQEIRRERLLRDAVQMGRLNSSVIQVQSFGDPPERYVLTVRVRGIISDVPRYRDQHQVEIKLPTRYPMAKPEARMLTKPQPFHPNWWKDGRWCSGDHWNPSESLGLFVVRMVRTLQYDPEITNPGSPANGEAARWYRERQTSGLFPCDRTVLPDPEKERLRINSPGGSRLTIRSS